MLAQVRERDGRQVYRPLLARVLLVVMAAFGVWWGVDLVLRGRPGAALLTLLWTVAALAALAAVFWRPAVVVDDDGVELLNVLRDVRVPWAALDGVETRFALTLVCGGRRYSSWAATSGGRPPRRRPSDVPSSAAQEVAAASSHPRTASGATAFVVQERWNAWREAAAVRARLGGATPDVGAPGVTVTWRPLLLAVAAAAAALAGLLTPVLTS